MILYTFFDSYDLSGKTIAPFCTSGGSSLSGTVNMGIRIDEPASWPALGNGFECGGKSNQMCSAERYKRSFYIPNHRSMRSQYQRARTTNASRRRNGNDVRI